MKIATCLALCLCAFSAQLAAQKAQLPSARHSFQELLDAKDASIAASLAASHAYVCYEDKKDEFLLVSFQDPASAWLPLAGAANRESTDGFASLQQYVGGAIDPQGVTISLPGQWQRTPSSPDVLSFSAANRKGATAALIGGNIIIDNGQFDVVENYHNADESQVEYRFALRRSTGRFSESYRIVPKAGPIKLIENSGYCAMYRDGVLTNPEPQRTPHR